ncbi:MAG: aminopeptidase, partial [Bacteroidota bacterium]
MNTVLNKYAKLLVNYCVSLKPGERLYVKTTTLAEPLVREVYREALRAGGHVEIDMAFREKGRIFYAEASGEQLEYISPLYEKAVNEFDAYI